MVFNNFALPPLLNFAFPPPPPQQPAQTQAAQVPAGPLGLPLPGPAGAPLTQEAFGQLIQDEGFGTLPEEILKKLFGEYLKGEAVPAVRLTSKLTSHFAVEPPRIREGFQKIEVKSFFGPSGFH